MSTDWNPEESNLHQHALAELKRTDLLDDDGEIYGDMLGKAVLELIDTFAKQGHSGMSGTVVLQVFNQLVDFKALTPITNDPAEWNNVGGGLWQSSRQSDAFSTDGGKTYYVLSERDTIITAPDPS